MSYGWPGGRSCPDDAVAADVALARHAVNWECTGHNRFKGLLSGQGSGINRFGTMFGRLEALRTGDGRELPPMLKAEIRRELKNGVSSYEMAREGRDALIARKPRSRTTRS